MILVAGISGRATARPSPDSGPRARIVAASCAAAERTRPTAPRGESKPYRRVARSAPSDVLPALGSGECSAKKCRSRAPASVAESGMTWARPRKRAADIELNGRHAKADQTRARSTRCVRARAERAKVLRSRTLGRRLRTTSSDNGSASHRMAPFVADTANGLTTYPLPRGGVKPAGGLRSPRVLPPLTSASGVYASATRPFGLVARGQSRKDQIMRRGNERW